MTRKRTRSSANAITGSAAAKWARVTDARVSEKTHLNFCRTSDERGRAKPRDHRSRPIQPDPLHPRRPLARMRARARSRLRREALLSCWNSCRSTSSRRYREKRRLVANRYEPTESQITRQTTSLSLPPALRESVSLKINTAATTIDSVSPELPEWFRYTYTRTRK